jgi:hypothetical protein
LDAHLVFAQRSASLAGIIERLTIANRLPSL